MMNCILVFDQLNDILFTKYNKHFLHHVGKLGRAQGLIPEGQDCDVGSNVIIQLFSPIVTSQRIMSCQFGNSYTSVQCQDGTNMVFDEYMGYLFVHIGIRDVVWLKRMLGVCISIVKHICGPDISLLKKKKSYHILLSRMLDTWIRLQDSDQAVLVEAIEQLMVNFDLNATTMKALQDATEKLKSQTDFSHVHALVLVQNKFLSLYSSRNAQDLSPADIIFLSLLCESLQGVQSDTAREGSQSEAAGESSDEFYSPPDSPDGSPGHTCHEGFKHLDINSIVMENVCNTADGINSLVVLLMGTSEASYNPHAVHICVLEDGVFLLLIIETGTSLISLGLSEALDALNAIQNVQLQKDVEGVKHAFENLDAGIKKLFDGLKKHRNNLKPAAERCHKKLQSKWDFIRKKYIEFMKTMELDCVVRIESSTSGFVDSLKELLGIVCLDTNVLVHGREVVVSIAAAVRTKLSDFSDFLKVKALRNFTLGSASLTINKYLEEFPGLVHFLYINRCSHRITAPSLDFTSEETNSLTKKKIWSMIEFSREHLQDGHLALMWKDTTFNYAYFLWFEDSSGSPLKVKVFPTAALKNLPMPGIMCGDFYRKLVEICFPKMSPSKVNCYELYCIHLGLATSSCVLEHSRRLAATIWEVTGIPNNPIDLL